ncbi:ubiquitin carboxyl-terminal hydrolase 47-like isoform X4 [Rhinoraja longicauda]
MINKLHTAMEPEQNILKFYQINMVQSLKCSWCTSHIQIDCPFLDLPLLIHSANSSRKFEHLEMALREFLKEQTMEDDNACYCDSCNTKTKTKIRYYFNHLPRILTFQLKRVNIDGFRMRYQKINDYVTLPLSIEFNKSQDNCNEWILKATRGKENDVQNTHCPESTDRGQSFAPTQAMQAGDAVDGEGRKVEAVQDQSGQDSSEEKEKKYELFAIWHHVGGFGGGHYYAEIKSVADGNWYCFNDRTVEQRGKDISLRSKTAYLIMYRVPETNSISAAEDSDDWTIPVRVHCKINKSTAYLFDNFASRKKLSTTKSRGRRYKNVLVGATQNWTLKRGN